MIKRFFLRPSVVLLLSDCIAVLASCGIAFLLRTLTGGTMPIELYAGTLPWLAVFPVLYFMLSLYPATFMRRPEELKRLCIATSIGFLVMVFFTFMVKGGHNFSRLILLQGWLLSLFAVPFLRHMARGYGSRFPWWTLPCVMFGSGDRVTELCAALKQAQRLGVRPAALVLDSDAPLPDLSSVLGPADGIIIERIPLADPEQAKAGLDRLTRRYAQSFAVVSFNSSNMAERQLWLNIIDRCFQRLIIIPDMAVGDRVWVMAVAIGRLSGILMRQNLLDPRRMYLKRALDCLLTVFGGIVAFPLIFALAVAIRLDSPGPAFFRHRRIGRKGSHFNVFKFRTMAVDGDAILARHLAENPEARAEWEADHKLRNDPRVTRIGRFLRKTSLDELPQLINVLTGDMSLVGPRPIVDKEIEKYGPAYELYIRVRPGITGLWQVSGRNNTTYADRVWFDRHYVCNWSVWFDLLIIARTVPEVLRCSGAY